LAQQPQKDQIKKIIELIVDRFKTVEECANKRGRNGELLGGRKLGFRYKGFGPE